MGEEREECVKCSTCDYEGTIRVGDATSIYDAICPQCGHRTLFLYYILLISGG